MRFLVLVVLLVGGCSAFMTRAPHAPRPGQEIVCTDSYRAPVTDSVAAVIGVGGGLAAWIIVNDHRDNSGVAMTDTGFDFTELFVKSAAVVSIIGGLAYGFAAVAGYDTAKTCNRMKSEYPRGYGTGDSVHVRPSHSRRFVAGN